ncbi:MAG: 4-hydroxythreonine-4-phosphate dehydrogenase PdxA [Actinomycetaceae bacterium]|nr:4-hydroxythreonine-4-phosphate dehydrogenase PdxA [Actinomycetaceae bacterium]MDY5272533.1 4-hydroxythreonine-4-phosphate dehydrogenase PdxA [Arcanobacterium sp.]
MARTRIAMTIGDPSGVGPEIAMKLLARAENLAKADVYLLASQKEVDAFSEELGLSVPTELGLSVPTADASAPASATSAPASASPMPAATMHTPGRVTLVGSDRQDIAVPRGIPSIEGGQRVMADLLKALQMYKDGQVDSILFMSLNKSALHWAGMHEEDELRWFAMELGYDGFTSELNFIPGLATSRVTSHCGIKDVAERINARAVRDAITLLNSVLAGSGVEHPRIAVCALNPHGGENGQFGREEIDHICPGIELARFDGVTVDGPFPPDTTFLRAMKGEYDGVVTMYHDQGQIALKTIGFDEGVTVQGGLPVPICTPAHGTAYEIVGQNKASIRPAQRAFDIATSLGAAQRAAM